MWSPPEDDSPTSASRLHRDTQRQDAPAVWPPNRIPGTEPSHLYSMRQAIEEGFIHDVLANYTTYETFWRIEKTITEDPAFETAKARRAIARFVTLRAQPCPACRGRGRAVPPAGRPQDRRTGQGDGRHLVPTACGAVLSGAAATSTTRAMTSGCWSRSPGPSATTATR